MKKDNMGKLLGVALVVAIICTGLFYMMFAMKANSETGAQIVVAAKALKAGTVLKAEDLKTINWPASQLPPGAHRNPEEVIGNTVFDPMAPEEPVLNARLANSLSGGGSGVPVGMRAVSVHLTDSTGVLALLHSGQKVDVQVVVGRGTKPDEVAVRTALENLTVLSVTPQPEQEFPRAELTRGDAAGETFGSGRIGGGRFRWSRAARSAQPARFRYSQARLVVARQCNSRRLRRRPRRESLIDSRVFDDPS